MDYQHPQVTKNFPIKKGVSAENILNNAEKEISILNESLKANGRLLVRKSGTENKIRIMVESTKKSNANIILQKAKNILQKNIL